ncbi:NFACT family protein [Aetokthonos hydrillicola Thurmond2011]|uniref:Rqc2 homolog RqcH n=1 Tax=Aetokthonos hydrillicola Thurmond2011 TaxID=2712845 RepID=A0AAP5M7S8_9CYAN|nr:NFACT family protein [Aetokthonos hydrillicola]MBO3463903.1 fibronectin-binding domain-containing protein [Aetokthonos hydrillicola CCALA 1050]MBW4584316.1 NFACT family protein [Aetokthonos hydrillicola CCALA 1050]MDR9898476.1 NFACT family protein [Aetokthonos hydrillicola Thurmond2011]
MQTVDFTTLTSACCEIRALMIPSRLELVYQRDRNTIAIALRTIKHRSWLTICWHPQAAHICIGDPPPRAPDTFTFSQQLLHQLNGLALVEIKAIAPWERAVDFQFARRPGESALYHLYVEIMGKYSNVILADAGNIIITAAHQVNQQKSSVRPILTGQPYETPPTLTSAIPSLSESQQRWQERISLVPGTIQRQVLKTYRGLSPSLLQSMLVAANLDPESTTDSLKQSDWDQLFQSWQEWLQALETNKYDPAWTNTGYTVLGWGGVKPAKNIQELINRYYTDQLNQQTFLQLRNQLSHKLSNILEKLRVKASAFEERLQQSAQADDYRQKADLLMAHLHNWEPGMKEIVLPDFDTGEPVVISLKPDKNAVQNAQALYKQHQKLKRVRSAVEPLLREVQEEIEYLEQVEAAISQIENYQSAEDLEALEEIRDELVGQKYLEPLEYKTQTSSATATTNFYRYRTPSGFEVLIGRNNRQNDQLTFRVAGDYDLWFHAQEIPGSHVLLRLEPGAVPEAADLQYTANLAAYYSRARQSDQVPVVYTKLKNLYKPKGAKPGIAIYKHERIIWGQPQVISYQLSVIS